MSALQQNHSNMEQQGLFEEIVVATRTYLFPVIIVCGILGNAMCIYVCCSKKLRGYSSSFYLTLLAFYDSCALCTELYVIIDQHVEIINSDLNCQLQEYIYGIFAFLSPWTVCGFTIERFIAVYYPLYRIRLCSLQKSIYVHIATAVVPFIVNVPHILYRKLGDFNNKTNDYECSATNFELFLSLALVDTLLTLVIPAILVFSLNIMISYKIVMAQKDTFLQKSRNTTSNSHSPTTTGHKGERRDGTTNHAVTKMLLIVSFVFLFLNAPAGIMLVVSLYYQLTRQIGKNTSNFRAWRIITHMMMVMNYAIDFILYSAASQNFRNVAKQVLLQHPKEVLTSFRTKSSGITRNTMATTQVPPRKRDCELETTTEASQRLLTDKNENQESIT